VQLAAQALGCPPERIAKSLTFKTDNAVIMVVAAGDARVDNKKYKECFGTKAKMLSAEEVEELVGYAVGGVCPFAVNDGVDVYLDESLNALKPYFPPAAARTVPLS
jgi:prolyl-tRNA editing enzyme YbaK/EbsC (Cys-tRNA(Pro) deacylase)